MSAPSPIKWPRAIIALHWAMALCLLMMIGGGLIMTSAAEHAAAQGDWNARVFGLPIYDAYQLHKSVGVALFLLVTAQLLVRLKLPAPQLPSHMKPPEKLIARAAQIVLYGLMFAMPLAGWVLAASSTLGLPTVVFGAFTLPHPVSPDAAREELFSQIHRAGGLAMLVLVALHAAAALKHHFIDRDDVLREILPWTRSD